MLLRDAAAARSRACCAWNAQHRPGAKLQSLLRDSRTARVATAVGALFDLCYGSPDGSGLLAQLVEGAGLRMSFRREPVAITAASVSGVSRGIEQVRQVLDQRVDLSLLRQEHFERVVRHRPSVPQMPVPLTVSTAS